MELTKAIIIATFIICITVNSIHKRNKKTELVKEAIKNGRSISEVRCLL